jgi:hypothetical protein
MIVIDVDAFCWVRNIGYLKFVQLGDFASVIFDRDYKTAIAQGNLLMARWFCEITSNRNL